MRRTTRDRDGDPRYWRKPRKVPPGVDPIVQMIYRQMIVGDYTYGEVAEGSGVGIETLRTAWRHKNSPSFQNVRAVCDFLGIVLNTRLTQKAVKRNIKANQRRQVKQNMEDLRRHACKIKRKAA